MAGGRIPGLDDITDQSRRLDDIATKLDRIVASTTEYKKNVSDSADHARDLASQLEFQVKLFQKNAEYSQENVDKIVELSRKMDDLEKKSRKLVGVTETLSSGFDKVGKGLLKIGGASVTKGIDLLVEGIQRVYDLEERWARVTGEVNQRLGKLSPNMRVFWKESRQAESAIRGLGGELGEGTKMFAEFTAGFNQMDTQGFGKLGIQLAQGFDLGGESAGKFLRTLDNIGFDERKKEASEFMKSIVVGADTAGVSVNALAKDFAESSNFVARFGKEGAKALTKSAAYLKQFNISLRDTEKMMDKFDTFDSAAESVAKLNVVFGTSINALNTMLEQDPAKRFDQIRVAMLQQGKTWDKLTYFERKAFVSTTGMTEDQAAAMLDVKNAGKTYSQFLAENAANQRKAADAQKMMQQQLRATAKTLFNFGAAADRITVAIANAIRPFTDMLGLTKSSDKQWKSFSQIMESVTQTIIRFFNTLAKNRQWKDFMEKAADLTKRLVGYVADFFSPTKIGRNIDSVIGSLKTFAKVSAGIVALWGASKFFGGITGAAGLVKDVASLRSTFGAGRAARDVVSNTFPGAIASGRGLVSQVGGAARGGLGPGGKMMLGGAAGALAGGLAGHFLGATKGGAMGGGAGGAIGSLFGPIGTAVGTGLGTAIGVGVEKLLDTPEAQRLRRSMKELEGAQLSLQESSTGLESAQIRRQRIEEERSRKDRDIDQIVTRGKRHGISLDAEQRASLAERLVEMKKLGVSVGSSDEALRKLGDPSSGAATLSADQVALLGARSTEYKRIVEGLRDQSSDYLDNLVQSTEIDNKRKKLDLDKADIENQIKQAEIEKKRADDQKNFGDEAVLGVADAMQTLGITNSNLNANQKALADKQRTAITAEGRLQDLQKKRNELETQSVSLDTEEIRFRKAKLQLDTISQTADFMALQKQTGDVAMALEQYVRTHAGVGAEALGLVRGQARTSRGVGAPTPMDFEPDVVSMGGAKGLSVESRSDVYMDGDKVGYAAHRHVIKHAAKTASRNL